jgi:hypothetical protein
MKSVAGWWAGGVPETTFASTSEELDRSRWMVMKWVEAFDRMGELLGFRSLISFQGGEEEGINAT